jgi:hypothetical protein
VKRLYELLAYFFITYLKVMFVLVGGALAGYMSRHLITKVFIWADTEIVRHFGM